jgi:mono/diheme cytochrome c family protein
MYFHRYLSVRGRASATFVLACGLAFCLRAQEPAAKPDDSKADKAKQDIADMIRKAMGQPPPPDPAKVQRGQGIFVANCAFCHGSSATGGEGGPDLVRSVLVLHDTNGDKIGPVVLNGRPAKGMPKFSLSEAQITDIAAFLKSQAESKAMRFSYKIQNVVTGDPKAGQAYFEAHCAECHSASGDLKGVATRYDPTTLQSRFLYPKTETFPGMPPSGPPPKPTLVTVTMPDGTRISGTLRHLDSFNVSFYDSDGNYHSLLLDRTPGIKVETHDPLASHIELLQQYSNADMHNILAYLETLK